MPRVTITVPEKNAQPYRFQLDRMSVTLGRGSENDIPIDSGSVSVKHAEMRRVAGGYELRDLGSTNGIKLDNMRRDTIALRNGMLVKLGDVAFDFMLTDEELEALAREPVDVDASVPDAMESSAPKLPPLNDDPSNLNLLVDPLPEDHGGGNFGTILLLLLLAAAAFCGGMALRFQKDTGTSLIQAIKMKAQPQNAPTRIVAPTPVGAPDTTPEPTPAVTPEPAPAKP